MMIPYPEDWALAFCKKYKIENWQLVADIITNFDKLDDGSKKILINFISSLDLPKKEKKELLNLLKNL